MAPLAHRPRLPIYVDDMLARYETVYAAGGAADTIFPRARSRRWPRTMAIDAAALEALRLLLEVVGPEHVVMIGASVPIVLIDLEHGVAGGRTTRDIDAVVRATWDDYEALIERLVAAGFRQGRVPHRLDLGTAELDLSPYSRQLAPNDVLEWPGSERTMSTLGFEEAFHSAHPVRVADNPPLLPQLILEGEDLRHLPVHVKVLLEVEPGVGARPPSAQGRASRSSGGDHVSKRRHLRLAHSQHSGRLRLGQLSLVQHLVEGIGQLKLGLALSRVRIAKICEDVARTANHLIVTLITCACHSAPRSPAARPSGAERPARYPGSKS